MKLAFFKVKKPAAKALNHKPISSKLSAAAHIWNLPNKTVAMVNAESLPHKTVAAVNAKTLPSNTVAAGNAGNTPLKATAAVTGKTSNKAYAAVSTESLQHKTAAAVNAGNSKILPTKTAAVFSSGEKPKCAFALIALLMLQAAAFIGIAAAFLLKKAGVPASSELVSDIKIWLNDDLFSHISEGAEYVFKLLS